MAEAFVKTLKRDYARVSPCPDAASVLRQLDGWFEHYNTVHPHKALGYRPPREFRKVLVAETIENAVDAVRRPHEYTLSADAIGSSPKPPQAVAPAPGLTRAQPWTNRKDYSLSDYSGATTAPRSRAPATR
jgi:putative transposase